MVYKILYMLIGFSKKFDQILLGLPLRKKYKP
jgi:hypothetical protein